MGLHQCESCGAEVPAGAHSQYDCIDALRAKLADVEARCADVERERDANGETSALYEAQVVDLKRERDEAQQPRIADRCPSCGGQTLFIGSGGWLTCSVIGCKAPGAAGDLLARSVNVPVGPSGHIIARIPDLALAASQAECARLREAGSALAHWATPLGSIDAMIQAEQLRLARVQWAALASAPGSTDALREVCERVVRRLWVERDAHEHAYKRQGVMFDASAFVSRILGERSDDAPQGRGERGKEGGDE